MKPAALLFALLFSGSVFCQTRIVVPFPPGGGADALARLMAPRLSELWQRQVIVENKPGASGHIGADFVAQAAPDGATLLMSSTASLTEKNVHQFAPVTLVSASPYVLAFSLKTGISNVKELISYAKANPGKLTFGSSGSGAASHLSGELFKFMAKVDLLHVPYKGTGQAVTDLLAGQIDLVFAPSQSVILHVQAGKLRALATTGARRSETLPDLPTVAESGLPGYEAVGWFGLLAPAATPREVILKLNGDLVRVLKDADLRKKAAHLGAEISANSPGEFARFIREDQAKWSKLMREAGIRPE
jgi:tripartite-type tricarboxylate transporter receptor subunit TctC